MFNLTSKNRLLIQRKILALFFAAFISNACYASDEISADEIEVGSTLSNTEHRQILTNFFNAVEMIKKNYVQSVSEKKLYQDAIRGMLQGLDPHSTYLDEEDLKFLSDTTSGQYVGVGLELTQENHVTKIISALDDSPAQKANIKPGDILLKINNAPVIRMPLQDVIKKMQGKENTILNLTLFRQGKSAPFTVQLTRKKIQLKSVKYQLLKPGYGYIRIAYFQENTAEETKQALNALSKESGGKLEGIIIDLRNNPGGLLDSAISVTDHFIDGHKAIVSARGRTPESKFAIDSTEFDLTHKTPIVVLINGGSASGAEIVAGALQDYHRAIIMGQTSFGKGSVQTVIPLDNVTAIKLTTSLYYTPSGRSIQARGIVPDIKLEEKILTTPSKAEENAENDLSIKESELSNHLSNNQKENTKKSDPVAPSINSELLSDYQVQEALHLLEGLGITRKKT